LKESRLVEKRDFRSLQQEELRKEKDQWKKLQIQEEEDWKQKHIDIKPTVAWYAPIAEDLRDAGVKLPLAVEIQSKEAEIQRKREQSLDRALYWKESSIPISPEEPPEDVLKQYYDMSSVPIVPNEEVLEGQPPVSQQQVPSVPNLGFNIPTNLLEGSMQNIAMLMSVLQSVTNNQGNLPPNNMGFGRVNQFPNVAPGNLPGNINFMPNNNNNFQNMNMGGQAPGLQPSSRYGDGLQPSNFGNNPNFSGGTPNFINSNNPPPNFRPTNFNRNTGRSQCKYFNTPQGCSFGDACRFLHDVSPGNFVNDGGSRSRGFRQNRNQIRRNSQRPPRK